jgi:two-component system nitrogen regulation sensor histidine kinase NtrY
MNLRFKKIFNIHRIEQRRLLEMILMVVFSLLLIALSRLEGRLFDLSERLSVNQDFMVSVVYFGLINTNVLLILILAFLIFRNVIKLVIERKHGVIGSRLRTKLVVALVFFALAPTALLFYVSTRFITESFETWFSTKVEDTIVKTKEAGTLVYRRDKRRVESLARVALQKVKVERSESFPGARRSVIRTDALENFADDYRLQTIKIFDSQGKLIWSNHSDDLRGSQYAQDPFILISMDRFLKNPTMSSRGAVEVESGHDVVKGIVPIRDKDNKTLLGTLLAEERFDSQIILSVETILAEFSNLRPSAQLIKLSYTILLGVIVFIILFSATWLGFYVAREILSPIQGLAEATRAIAVGNYEVTLEERTDDEMGQLLRSFNRMVKDLKSNDEKVKRFTEELERKNLELDSRRKYMEVVLKNISAGVISVDANNIVTSINDAAEKLLRVDHDDTTGNTLTDGSNAPLLHIFLQNLLDQMDESPVFHGQVELDELGQKLTLLATANRILDENNDDLGIVIVFHDASEQVQAQRVAAWREVARRIAHEIKNPITPIKLCAQRLVRRFSSHFTDEKDHSVFNSCLDTIIAEVDSLRDLVNEFTKFSRLPTIKAIPTDLNKVILSSIAHYQSSYPHIDFTVEDLAAGLPLIPLDEEQMGRALGNLISNAIAAMPESLVRGCIAFKTTLISNLNIIRIDIADNGVGIPEKLRHRVLEPYFSTKPEGTGLGLAIVNQIVTDHGGYLRIENNHPSGTVIVIELPLERA